MSWHQNFLNTKVHPCGSQIGQRDTPIFLPLVDLRLIGEPIHPVALGKITLVILVIVLVGDTKAQAEKGRKKGILVVC
jgi:hypothetical protein